ncbi:MAG TPA: hypothetical protein VMV23_08625 [Candidatus Nanopelagicaceae bacterium]|nr:hypothetical protein [Candidatus Nanopelagicaceae bacterium]
MTTVPSDLAARDLRLLRAMRALPDGSLDRARAHLAACLPLRRAELGWRGSGAADDGCLVGVAMSRLEFLRSPRRLPGLLLLTAVFDSWAFEEARRREDLEALRAQQLPAAARRRLGELLDIEHHRRHGRAGAVKVEVAPTQSLPR